jgi:hypothetical protein
MYLDTVDFIKGICQTINPNGTFYHGRVSDANLAIKDNPMPQIHLYPFRVQNPSNMGVDVNPNILMAFLFDGSPHDGADDLLNSTDEADTMQRRFHLALQGSGKIVSNYEAEPFYKQFSGVTNGMFVRFQLQIKSSKVCEP